MSIAAVLAFRWDGKKSRMFFETTADTYNGEKLMKFITNLKQELRGRKCILIWDGLPAHKSKKMKLFLSSHKKWLSVEKLPGYAPDLNPVESIWSCIKGQELANLCAADLGEAAKALRRGMNRVDQHKDLAWSFLKHAGLFI